MKKALLVFAFTLASANFALAEESTANKINDNLNKTGDKIESAFGKDNQNKVNNDLNKAGDKMEGAADKTAVKAKKSARHASDKVCETVNGKTKCVRKKMKHAAQNAEDEVKSEIKH